MSALREAIVATGPFGLTAGGLAIGLAFGALVAATNFCTMGGLSDWRTLGDTRRLRAWILAIAVSIAGTQALAAVGVTELARAMYLAPSLNWLGSFAGGVLFGVGMVYAGGCASRNLARVGGGDLRSLVTLLLIGLFAYMTIGGLLGPVRSAVERATSLDLAAGGVATQSLPDLLGRVLPVAPGTVALGLATIAALGLAAFCFADAGFRASPNNIAAGLGIGMLVTAGWALTGLAFDELADKPVAPVSLTFVRPTGDTMEWLGRFTALGLPGFGVASVIGAILGAFLVAVAKGSFRIQTFADAGDTLRNMGGAALMGIGGVTAGGCTVGQGITGLSTLAAGSVLALAGIVIGGRYGLARLERALEG